MPSETPKMAKFMAACAHGANYPSCPSSKVAKEFNQADKGTGILRKGYAKGGEVRDPSSHRTPSQIREMDRGYNHTPEHIDWRSQRNQARALLAKEGLVHKGDGKDVGHKRMVSKGGSNARSNLMVQTPHSNRGWRRDT